MKSIFINRIMHGGMSTKVEIVGKERRYKLTQDRTVLIFDDTDISVDHKSSFSDK